MLSPGGLRSWGQPYPRGWLVEAVQCAGAGIQDIILDQHGDGSQNEGEEQVQVDVVSGTVQLPEEDRGRVGQMIRY